MRILIVGCGRTGSRLANRLSREGHKIAILDENREAFTRLDSHFDGITYQGSGLDRYDLERAGAPSCDIVLALTGGDNRNLMIAQSVQVRYGIQRVVARLHDPVRAAKFRELGI